MSTEDHNQNQYVPEIISPEYTNIFYPEEEDDEDDEYKNYLDLTEFETEAPILLAPNTVPDRFTIINASNFDHPIRVLEKGAVSTHVETLFLHFWTDQMHLPPLKNLLIWEPLKKDTRPDAENLFIHYSHSGDCENMGTHYLFGKICRVPEYHMDRDKYIIEDENVLTQIGPKLFFTVKRTPRAQAEPVESRCNTDDLVVPGYEPTWNLDEAAEIDESARDKLVPDEPVSNDESIDDEPIDDESIDDEPTTDIETETRQRLIRHCEEQKLVMETMLLMIVQLQYLITDPEGIEISNAISLEPIEQAAKANSDVLAMLRSREQ